MVLVSINVTGISQLSQCLIRAKRSMACDNKHKERETVTDRDSETDGGRENS